MITPTILDPTGKPAREKPCAQCERYAKQLVEQAALLDVIREAAVSIHVQQTLDKRIEALIHKGRIQHHVDRMLGGKKV